MNLKSGMLLAGAIAVAGAGTAIIAQGKEKDDRDVARNSVSSMSAEQLQGAESGSRDNGPEPLSAEKVRAVVEDLKDIEANGGLLRIARKHECSMAQVKLIRQERSRRLAEMNEESIEPGRDVVEK